METSKERCYRNAAESHCEWELEVWAVKDFFGWNIWRERQREKERDFVWWAGLGVYLYRGRKNCQLWVTPSCFSLSTFLSVFYSLFFLIFFLNTTVSWFGFGFYFRKLLHPSFSSPFLWFDTMVTGKLWLHIYIYIYIYIHTLAYKHALHRDTSIYYYYYYFVKVNHLYIL